jgi:meso-butanediol dehydrogenase / (S,S)-butanediol dehydrogenase / diacetyl reductase
MIVRFFVKMGDMAGNDSPRAREAGAGSRFQNRVALITGAGHGIGRATALRLADEGARVVVLDMIERRVRETCEAVDRSGGQAVGVCADVSDEAAVGAALEAAAARCAPADVLVTCAGVLIAGSVHELSLADWDRAFAVNVRGTFVTVRQVLPAMLGRGGGAIVTVGSTSGLKGEAASAAYNASKAAIINLTRQLAADYSASHIRANCVCPGWVDTGFNAPVLEGESDEEIQTMIDATVPLKRQGTPEEIAAGIAFLASDDASYVNGHALVIDGGLMAV